MNVKDALRGSGLPSADAEVLLSHTLGKDRSWLLGHSGDELTAQQWTQFAQWTERRRKHEPVAYITGVQEFYGREFLVDRRVLIPRPATEGVVTAALRFLEHPENAQVEVDSGIIVTSHVCRRTGTSVRTIVDIGTGSGCIAITLALERPDLKIIATDVSADALEVAQANAERLHANVIFKLGDGLNPIEDFTEPFLLVSNPPYIPSGNDLMSDVKDFEPHVALFGGKKGGEIVRNFQEAAENHPACVGWVMEYGAKP